jgi:hypothetical protein
MLRRLRKPLPAMFAIICLINFAGGAFNDVTNGDSISYRIPRVLHWLSENGWHWIHTADDRMNGVGCNVEWLSAPFILFNQDRFAFLVSFSAYLLLPGIFFSFLRLTSVSAKVAWWWAWLLPAGWIFAMQSNSFATDGFSATPAIAAVLFALRGGKFRRIDDLWISLLAIGLLTGTKQTTLPLLLVWVVAIFGSLRILATRLLATIGVLVIGLAASALPITIANIHYLGDWKGLVAGASLTEQKNPFWGVVGNVFVVIVQNFQPPVFPQAPAWNNAMDHFVATPAGRPFSHFEHFARLGRAPSELNSGLGFGLACLLVVTILALFRNRRPRSSPDTTAKDRLIQWLPFVSVAAFMAKSALSETGRYIAPYYPFFFPILLVRPAHSKIISTQWWRAFAFVCMLLTIGLLVISRQRPFFPADLVTSKLQQHFRNNRFVAKIRNAYSFATQSRDLTSVISNIIPPNEMNVGYAANKSAFEPAVWRSAPGRRVYRFNPDDDRARARALGIQYIFVDATLFWGPVDTNLVTWLERFPGKVIAEFPNRSLPDAPSQQLSYIVKLDPAK